MQRSLQGSPPSFRKIKSALHLLHHVPAFFFYLLCLTLVIDRDARIDKVRDGK